VRRLTFPAPYLLHAPSTYERASGARGGHQRRSFRSWQESYERQLVHFHACVTAGRRCRTPPEQARRDIALLTELFRASAGVAA
jgi:hypothetical protein